MNPFVEYVLIPLMAVFVYGMIVYEIAPLLSLMWHGIRGVRSITYLDSRHRVLCKKKGCLRYYPQYRKYGIWRYYKELATFGNHGLRNGDNIFGLAEEEATAFIKGLPWYSKDG